MHAANATELFLCMASAISRDSRRVSDKDSPCREEVLEAIPGQTFELSSSKHNVVACRSVDLRWAIANALHFFAQTEDAEPLLRYNRHAAKFLTDGRWTGAYGAIAMPQVRECIRALHADSYTRRAIVSMGGPTPRDINRPACWSFLQFLRWRDRLDMLVYQRSLQLYTVMPYDCIVLCNLLATVAVAVSIPPGSIRWTCGSLHRRVTDELSGGDGQRLRGIHVPYPIAINPTAAWNQLAYPETFQDDVLGKTLLLDEART